MENDQCSRSGRHRKLFFSAGNDRFDVMGPIEMLKLLQKVVASGGAADEFKV